MKKIYFVLFALANVYAYSQCTPRTLPFTEDFAGTPLATCGPTTGGWVSTSAASGADWWIPSPPTNYAGGSAPEVEAYGNQANGGISETISLTSPPMNTSAVSSYTMSFKHNLYTTSSGASGSNVITLKLETSPDNVNWTQAWLNTYNATPSLTSVVTETRSINASTGIGATTYFRFSISGVLFKVWGWEIDDVNVTGTTGTTGIQQLHAKGMQVSPNPFNETLVVNCEQGGQVCMMDMMGKVVYHENNAKGVVNIDTRAFPAGLYIVKMNGPAGSSMYKIFKN